jgi:hypothetical protein
MEYKQQVSEELQEKVAFHTHTLTFQESYSHPLQRQERLQMVERISTTRHKSQPAATPQTKGAISKSTNNRFFPWF